MADSPSESVALTLVDASDDTDPLTSSTHPSRAPTPSLPWYRTSLRHLYTFACSLLLLLNLLSSLLERRRGCSSNAIAHGWLSLLLYALLLLYLTAFIPRHIYAVDLHHLRSTHTTASTTSTSSTSSTSIPPAQLQLTFITALTCIVLFAFGIYSLVTLFVDSSCDRRVLFAFVLSLDCAVPLFLSSFIVTYAGLHTLAHYRHHQNDGDLSSLTSPPHLHLYAAASLLFSLNLSATLIHLHLIHDRHTLPQWVFTCTYTALYALLSTALLAALVYRLSLSPRHQHALLTTILTTLSPLALSVLVGLALTATLVLLLTSLLSFIFFAIHPSVGGLAVLVFVNLGATLLGVAGVGWVMLRHQEKVNDFVQDVWRKVRADG